MSQSIIVKIHDTPKIFVKINETPKITVKFGNQGLRGNTGPTGPTGAPGPTDHNQLTDLDYAHSGHTGFQKEMIYISDFKAYEIN